LGTFFKIETGKSGSDAFGLTTRHMLFARFSTPESVASETKKELMLTGQGLSRKTFPAIFGWEARQP
jgi:hypothetical protein